MAAFDGWAEYYDLIHDGLPGDVEFYGEQAVRCGGPVLEVGIGTGRIALPMLARGIDVTGLDDSESMLKLCRGKKTALGKTPGKLTLVRGDMRTFELGAEFSLVAMPYRTFMHLLTPDDRQRCLTAVRRHMSPAGRFVLNIWAPNAASLRSVLKECRTSEPQLAGQHTLPDSGRTVLHYYMASCDESRHWLIERHVIQEFNRRGQIRREVVLPLVRAWTTPREMNDLARRCGFRVEARYGDFRGGAFTGASTELILVLGLEGIV